MSNLPLVSVFLPTYNHEKYVAASIDSIVNQDYERIEIVIGDDCSTDGTWGIVKDYQSRYPSIIRAFRNKENIGITGNCNEILKRCTGKYIAFTAGDDVFLPGKITAQVHAMMSDESIVLSYHNVEVFLSESNRTLYTWNSDRKKPLSTLAVELARALIISENSIMAGMSVMVKRAAIPPSGYDKRLPVASDWLMWIDVLLSGEPTSRVLYIPKIFSRYRRHDSNITNGNFGEIDDLLVTLAIAENRYTNIINEIEKCRSSIRYKKATRLLLTGNHRDARILLRSAMMHKIFDWRYIYWLTSSFFPFILVLRKLKFRVSKKSE
jgi:glycosyltransferase involved in cell wall biosynthesis